MQNRVFNRALNGVCTKSAMLLLALAMGVTAAAAPEEPPTALAMTGDILIARPVGVAVTAVGVVAFVASLPFTALGGNVGQAGKTLILAPGKETFVRCLGCTSSGRYVDPNKEKGSASK